MSDQHDTEPISKMMRLQSGDVEINMPRSYFRSNLVVSLSKIFERNTEFKINNLFIPSRLPRHSKPILPIFTATSATNLARLYQEENFVKARDYSAHPTTPLSRGVAVWGAKLYIETRSGIHFPNITIANFIHIDTFTGDVPYFLSCVSWVRKLVKLLNEGNMIDSHLILDKGRFQ